MTSSENKYDVAIVGGGIVGLANAWMAARRGQRVVMIERSPVASGASVRNFGMVWPIGQPPGELFDLAMKSREYWLEAASNSVLWLQECGSLHLARHDDEMEVIEQYFESSTPEQDLQLLAADETAKKSQAAKLAGLKGSLWSPWELCVNPVEAISQLKSWLEKDYQVTCHFGTTAIGIDGGRVYTSDNQCCQAERICVCSGIDFETLYPAAFKEMGLIKCKLQMVATDVQPDRWRFGPHVAGGLTLRHYQSFADCPSLSKLKQRVANNQPELDRWGIHVMAAQNNSGQVVMGDSHVYGDEISPFDSNEIEELILKELRELIDIPDFRVHQRWHGVYAKHPTRHVIVEPINDHCRIVAAAGGAGMTLSFGIADQLWDQW